MAGDDAGPAILRLVNCSLLVPPAIAPDGRSRCLAWALDHDAPTALRLVAAMAPWWLVRGRWIQGIGLLRRAVEQTGPDAGSWYTAHLWLGHLAAHTFDNASAIGHYSTVVDTLKENPSCADLVDAPWGRCAVLRNTSDLAKATSDACTALELARRIGYATGEAMALVELSVISFYADDDEPSAASPVMLVPAP